MSRSALGPSVLAYDLAARLDDLDRRANGLSERLIELFTREQLGGLACVRCGAGTETAADMVPIAKLGDHCLVACAQHCTG